MFPDLEILELVGAGGMGAVYKVRQKRLDRIAALKILLPQSPQEPTFSDRFAREARSLAKLEHPGIVQVYDFGEVSGIPWMLMAYVDGPNLRRLIVDRAVTPDMAIRIVREVCLALECAHGQGIVHRDLKPENILLDPLGAVRVVDFGLAKLDKLDATMLTKSRGGMGTLHYMAPEQLQQASTVDARADIFSVGVILYELLTGSLPIGNFSPPSKVGACSPQVDAVLMRCMSSDREGRFAGAGALLHALQQGSDVGTVRSESKGMRLSERVLLRIGDILLRVAQRVGAEIRAAFSSPATLLQWATIAVFMAATLMPLEYTPQMVRQGMWHMRGGSRVPYEHWQAWMVPLVLIACLAVMCRVARPRGYFGPVIASAIMTTIVGLMACTQILPAEYREREWSWTFDWLNVFDFHDCTSFTPLLLAFLCCLVTLYVALRGKAFWRGRDLRAARVLAGLWLSGGILIGLILTSLGV
ncbi:MAG: serine/threonine protein kinase [Planctomycetes bacterium]|nr:serine/threonine protein kinase [Planctomycetota bacterium]